MAQISSSDIICATVSSAGRQLLSIRISGMTSMKAVIEHIMTTLDNCLGLVTLHIRNLTEGWTTRHSIRIFG